MAQEKTVTITDFTSQEFDYLADMIHEKLIDMGYENDGSFAFDLKVSFTENTDNQR